VTCKSLNSSNQSLKYYSHKAKVEKRIPCQKRLRLDVNQVLLETSRLPSGQICKKFRFRFKYLRNLKKKKRNIMKNRKENGGSKSFTFMYSLSNRFIETYCDVI
jgi:hypothetical protein